MRLKLMLMMTIGNSFTKTLSGMTTNRTDNLLFIEQYDGTIDSIPAFAFPFQLCHVLNLDHKDLPIVSIVSDMIIRQDMMMMLMIMMKMMSGMMGRRKEEIHNEVLGAIGFSYQCSGVWRA